MCGYVRVYMCASERDCESSEPIKSPDSHFGYSPLDTPYLCDQSVAVIAWPYAPAHVVGTGAMSTSHWPCGTQGVSFG